MRPEAEERVPCGSWALGAPLWRPVGHDDGGQGPASKGDHRRGDPQGTLSSWSLLGFSLPMGPAAAIFFHNL